MLVNITHARVEADEAAERAEELLPYIQSLKEVAEVADFEAPEASINLPSDLALREVVLALHLEVERPNLKYIFLIGIGGSNLGVKAIYDALFGYADSIKNVHAPKIIFVDTNSTLLLRSTLELIDSSIENIDEFLTITISKSGGTTETIANTEIILEALVRKFGEGVYERTVGITGEGSEYEKELKTKGIRTLHIPKQVGGRYSVFSAVGLFPLLLAHIDIDELLSGALNMRNLCLDETFSENIALQSAISIFLSNKNGKTINTNFIFHPELESLGKWYRQLMAESVGKREDEKGNSICAGITPEVSIGSTDLHSMAQLYLGGPNDKITTFINTAGDQDSIIVNKERIINNIIPELGGRTNKDIMDSIYEGVKAAYSKGGRPFIEVLLEDISPYEIGAFMQFKMMEMMYLGRLFNVNPFNQPSVENYKTETKKILSEK